MKIASVNLAQGTETAKEYWRREPAGPEPRTLSFHFVWVLVSLSVGLFVSGNAPPRSASRSQVILAPQTPWQMGACWALAALFRARLPTPSPMCTVCAHVLGYSRVCAEIRATHVEVKGWHQVFIFHEAKVSCLNLELANLASLTC